MEYYKNLDLADIKYFCEFDLVFKIEEWKDVVGYEGHYKISDLGRLKSLKRNKEKILKLQIRDKYLKTTLVLNNNTFQISAHRLVALMFIENIDNKPEVNHKNGVGTYNIKNNLEWNTSSENTIHSYKNKLQISLKGSKHQNSKINELDVKNIRLMNKQGYSLNDISEKYNLATSTIYQIANKIRWKHVE